MTVKKKKKLPTPPKKLRHNDVAMSHESDDLFCSVYKPQAER